MPIMPDTNDDALAIIAADPPQLSTAEAIDVALQHYGLEVTTKPLVSERDQNFRVTDAEGGDYVLKIANAAENPDVTLLQIEALLHLQEQIMQHGYPLRVPEIRHTLAGESHLILDHGGSRHLLRLVSYLPGVPLSQLALTDTLSRKLGETLGWLGRALAGLEHPGAKQSLLWDMQQALQLRPLLDNIHDPSVRRLVAAALDDFEAFAQPVLAESRTQVIHSDLHGDNVLVATEKSDAIAGVIDFGDMLRAPLVIDLGVATAYLRGDGADPLRYVAAFVSAYNGVTELTAPEIDVLYFLIRARLAATIVIHHWRSVARPPDDPYLNVFSESRDSEQFLQELDVLSHAAAAERLREACR